MLAVPLLVSLCTHGHVLFRVTKGLTYFFLLICGRSEAKNKKYQEYRRLMLLLAKVPQTGQFVCLPNTWSCQGLLIVGGSRHTGRYYFFLIGLKRTSCPAVLFDVNRNDRNISKLDPCTIRYFLSCFIINSHCCVLIVSHSHIICSQLSNSLCCPDMVFCLLIRTAGPQSLDKIPFIAYVMSSGFMPSCTATRRFRFSCLLCCHRKRQPIVVQRVSQMDGDFSVM